MTENITLKSGATVEIPQDNIYNGLNPDKGVFYSLIFCLQAYILLTYK